MATYNWRGNDLIRQIKKAAMDALLDKGEEILTDSQEEVPHATGDLARSGDVTKQKERVYISYNTPYAIKQHEDLTLRHPDPTNPISSTGRKAKYLEDPYNRRKNEAIGEVVDRIGDVLRR